VGFAVNSLFEKMPAYLLKLAGFLGTIYNASLRGVKVTVSENERNCFSAIRAAWPPRAYTGSHKGSPHLIPAGKFTLRHAM
jgi:hypothetical protein